MNKQNRKTKLSRRIFSMLLCLAMLLTAFHAMPVAQTEVVYGDLDSDGMIDAKDALFVLRAAVNKVTPTSDQIMAGDVDASGDEAGNTRPLDAIDALMILQYAVGIIDVFPAQTLRNMTPEERYYYELDQEYKVDYSDFEEYETIENINDPQEIVEKLGGATETGDVQGYETKNGKLVYNAISKEAKRLGQTQKYKNAKTTSGTIHVGGTTVEYTVPTQMTAYDAVPVTYSAYSTEDANVHIQVNAFEEADRYANKETPYFDGNMPGEVAIDFTYEGYVNTNQTSTKPRLSYDPVYDIQGTAYPSFDVSEVKKSGTIKSGGLYTCFQFSYKNTGNTIIDGEGNSAFRFQPQLFKLEDGEWQFMSYNPNWYYPLLDYVYPGEGGNIWIMFNTAGGSQSQHSFDPGQYQIRLYGYLRSEHDRYSFDENQVQGRYVTCSTFDFEVTREGETTTPIPVKNESLGSMNRNGWLASFEEFMASYDTVYNIGATKAEATQNTMYVQPAPWTKQLVLKVINGDTNQISRVCIPVEVETDSISVTLNPYNKNYVIKEDGTREPMVYTQSMVNMRGWIDRGPYCADTIVNEIKNMHEAGINTITTTHAFTGDFSGAYDMSWFALDLVRKLNINYEGHCVYYYGDSPWRVRAYGGGKFDMGNRVDLLGRSQVDAANGILARWNLNRYGDFYVYDKETGTVPISIEDNYGWMTYKMNIRYGISDHSDKLLQQWLKTAYGDDINALNEAYNSSYESFDKISVVAQSLGDSSGAEVIGDVYYDQSPAILELDLFRTVERMNSYQEMLKYLDVENTKVYLRTENAVFLVPGISQTTDNVRYRHIYYEQRRAALVPEILQASGIVYGDSSYFWYPLYPSETYELTRQAAKAGFNTAKTPAFNHFQDIAINDTVGRMEYSNKLCLDSYTMAASVNTVNSLFTWFKAIYEAGGVPGTMWMDYNCDLYVTSTQYKELQFFHQKVQEMLATEEGKAWATSVPESATQNPLADIATGGYSYPESYIEDKLATTPRHNQILDFCKKNGQ